MVVSKVPSNSSSLLSILTLRSAMMGQASLLFDHVMRTSDERIAPLLRQVNQLQDVIAALANILAAQLHVDHPLSTVKRKHETITNEALKKQYQPLEEMQIRVDARVDAVQVYWPKLLRRT
jgi:hypothetical protein